MESGIECFVDVLIWVLDLIFSISAFNLLSYLSALAYLE